MSESPGALHLRTLATLNDLSSDQSNTIIFAIPIAASNILHYDDCRHSIITFDEEGSDTETVKYENGTGEFILLSTNELMWQDDVEEAGKDSLFVNEG